MIITNETSDSVYEEMSKRFDHHPPTTSDTVKAHESARAACKVLAIAICQTVPEGRERSLALTKIEEAMFWANAAIARN